MQYCNHDLDHNKFLIKHDEIVTDISTLKHKPLNQKIYFRPSCTPLVSEADADLGSCFDGYYIPTASFTYTKQGSELTCKKQTTNVSLDQYINQVHDQIANQVQQIYQHHAEVTLSYSGGIDSMVLLSFIEAQNLLPRTNIVCVENHTQTSMYAMHNHTDNKQKVTGLLAKLKLKLKSISWFVVDVQDIAHSFNHGNLEHVKCYTTYSILRRYNRTAFIFGYHGNQILLHKPLFVDELFLRRKISHQEFNEYLSTHKNFYTQCLTQYNTSKEKIGVDRTHFLKKPWALMDGVNDNRIYSPIGSRSTFDLLRSLDFDSVCLHDVANANVARHIIMRNVDTLFNDHIGIESLSDMDNLNDTLIPVNLLDQQLLTVPDNLNHHILGLEWIKHEIDSSKVSGVIPINSLTSIKMLNWIANL